MKKFFGVLILLVGLILTGGGAAGLADINSRHQTFDGQVSETFSNRYREGASEQQAGATAAIGVGIVLIIVGIVMLATKTKKQRKQETELALLKSMNLSNRNNANSDKVSLSDLTIPELFAKFNVAYMKKDFDTCISVSKQVLNIDQTNYNAYFNIAKIYSKIQFNDELTMLKNAFDNGFVDISKIDNDPDFEWIKKQKGYNDIINKPSSQTNNATFKTASINTFEDRMSKLEKLGKLKEQGLLTEEEFQNEKSKILE